MVYIQRWYFKLRILGSSFNLCLSPERDGNLLPDCQGNINSIRGLGVNSQDGIQLKNETISKISDQREKEKTFDVIKMKDK
jgi:hypothetical protein